MTDHDVIYNDIENYKPPVAPVGEDPCAYNMLNGLASFSMIDYTYNKFYSRNIPEEITLKILSYYINGYRAYRNLHNGEDEEGGGGNGALAVSLKYPCDACINLDSSGLEIEANGGGCFKLILKTLANDGTVASVFNEFDGARAVVD